MALCSILAFWSGGDKPQTDRLFRESGLMRPKRDERRFADGSTYGEKTTERAIAGTDESYRRSKASDSGLDPETVHTRDSSALDNPNSTESTDECLDRIETLETELATVSQALSGSGLRLDRVQLRVRPVVFEQLAVRPFFDDLAGVERVDPIGVLHRRQPVCDRDNSVLGIHRLDSPLDFPFEVRIQVTRRLVQHEEVGVFQ